MAGDAASGPRRARRLSVALRRHHLGGALGRTTSGSRASPADRPGTSRRRREHARDDRRTDRSCQRTHRQRRRSVSRHDRSRATPIFTKIAGAPAWCRANHRRSCLAARPGQPNSRRSLKMRVFASAVETSQQNKPSQILRPAARARSVVDRPAIRDDDLWLLNEPGNRSPAGGVTPRRASDVRDQESISRRQRVGITRSARPEVTDKRSRSVYATGADQRIVTIDAVSWFDARWILM